MAKQDIEPYLQNLHYKQAFFDLGLNLEEVFEFTPLELDLENRRLENLLTFVKKFQYYGSQELMEVEEGDLCFPPIFPGVSPESDWYRFEQWLMGQPVRKTIAEQLPPTFKIIDVEEIPESAMEAELAKLITAVEQAGYGFSLNEGIPARLVYKMVREWLGEEFELGEASGGGWFFDGCSGYCPDCVQRPWCQTGLEACWSEDEEVGKMFLTDELKKYVSASPQSLAILQAHQAEKNAAMAKFVEEHKRDKNEGLEDWRVEWN